jgi:hypothetical protein
MTLPDFMMEHPFISLLMLWLLCELALKLGNRVVRHLNILWRGWPPEHCDADGDLKREPENADDH